MFRSIGMKMIMVGAVGFGLCGCVQSQIRLEPDFGSAVVQDAAAQIADPDAHYTGIPAPGASDAARISLAQKRYQMNRVIPPSTLGASSGGGGGAFDNGGGGTNAPSGAGVGNTTGTLGP